MKNIKQLFLTVIFAFVSLSAGAYDLEFEVNGIRYGTWYGSSSVYVIKNGYTGAVEIPPAVSYKNVTYTVTGISEGAFDYNCKELTSLTIPTTIKSISPNAFGCTGIQEVHISSIDAWCRIEFCNNASNPLWCGCDLFLNGKLVTDCTIPYNNYMRVRDNIFCGCTSLKSVTIPDEMLVIGKNAFWGCANLEEVVTPKYLKSIQGYAFKRCYNLGSIIIPESITDIGSSVFVYCFALKSSYLYQPDPAKINVDDSAFDYFNTSACTLYVPEGSYELYSNATPWKNFHIVTMGGVEAQSIEIFPSEAQDLQVGESMQFEATVMPENTADKSVVWTSSDENIAVVNSEGLVTGVNSGTATITVRCGSVSAAVQVNIGKSQIKGTHTYTWVASECGYENAEYVVGDVTLGGCIMNFGIGKGDLPPTYYTKGSAVRFYPENTIEITSLTSYPIVEVTFFTTDDKRYQFKEGTTASNGVLSLGDTISVWKGNTQSVIFEINREVASGHVRISQISISVQYDEENENVTCIENTAINQRASGTCFDLQGRRVPSFGTADPLGRGVRILKYPDGTTKKVLR